MNMTAYTRRHLESGLANRRAATELANSIAFGASQTTGSIFFVNAVSGSDSAGSGSQDQPFATIDYAIGRCTANNGDIIFVDADYTQNLTAATSINCDVAGVSIIGLTSGGLMPTLSTTAAAGSVTIGAANVTIANIKFVANFATGTTAGVTVAAAGDGFTMANCKFRDTSTANEFLIHVSVATTVTDLTITGCSFVTLAGSLSNSILFAGTSSDVVIEGNHFFVDSADSVIDHLVGAATNILIRGNTIINQDTGAAGFVIDCHASSSGAAIENRGAYNKVDAEMTKGAAMWWCENYFTNTIAESGLLEPSTAHAIP